VPVACIFTGIAHSATGTLAQYRAAGPASLPVDKHLNYAGNRGYDLFVILHLQPHERPRVERWRAAIQRPKQLTRRVLEPCVRREPRNRLFFCAGGSVESRAERDFAAPEMIDLPLMAGRDCACNSGVPPDV